jgi:hypothetical protein
MRNGAKNMKTSRSMDNAFCFRAFAPFCWHFGQFVIFPFAFLILEEFFVFEKLLRINRIQRLAQNAAFAVFGLLGQRIGDELAANPMAAAVENFAEETVGPITQHSVAPMAEPCVGCRLRDDEACVVATADLRGSRSGDARAKFRVPTARLTEENPAIRIAEIFIERNACDTFVDVRLDAFIGTAGDQRVRDFDVAAPVPTFGISHAGADDSRLERESDEPWLDCGLRSSGLEWGGVALRARR